MRAKLSLCATVPLTAILIAVLISNIPLICGRPQPRPGPQDQLTSNPSEDFFPTWNPNGSRILFASDTSGEWKIYSMTPDGTDQTQITFLPGWDFCPAWSANGTKIAYLCNSSESNKVDIWLMNADGSDQHRLLPFSLGDMSLNIPPLPWSLPSWSPDGRAIAFAGYLANQDSYNIWIADSDGRSYRRLTEDDTFGDAYAAWSPDGTKIAFQSDRSGNLDIWVINSDGSNLKPLTQSPAEDIQPSWSPDGTQIAFISNRTDYPNVWVMNSDGSNQNQLTSQPFYEYYPSWSPDGTKIAFASTRSGNWDIWVINLTYPPGEVIFESDSSEAYVGRMFNVDAIVINYENVTNDFRAVLSAFDQDDFTINETEKDVSIGASDQQTISFAVIPKKEGSKTISLTLLHDSDTIDEKYCTINVKPLATLDHTPENITRTCDPDDVIATVITIRNTGSAVAEDLELDKYGSISGWIEFNGSYIGDIGQDQLISKKIFIEVPESGVSGRSYNGFVVVRGANIDTIEILVRIDVPAEDVIRFWIPIILPYLLTGLGGAAISAYATRWAVKRSEASENKENQAEEQRTESP